MGKSLAEGRFQFPSHFSPELIDLLTKMFTIDPTTRITTEQIAQHPWVNPHSKNHQKDFVGGDSVSETMLMDEEEPVYRSIEVDEAPPCNSTMGFACKPAHQFTTSKNPTEVMEFLGAQLREHGATWEVKPEKGQVKAECVGPSGDRVKVKIFVHQDSVGNTSISVKRMMGHALDFCSIFTELRPCVDKMCSST